METGCFGDSDVDLTKQMSDWEKISKLGQEAFSHSEEKIVIRHPKESDLVTLGEVLSKSEEKLEWKKPSDLEIDQLKNRMNRLESMVTSLKRSIENIMDIIMEGEES